MEALIFSFALATIAAAAFLAAKPLEKRILITCALLAAVYIGADDFVTGLPSFVKGLKLVGASWNWTGKLLSLALSATVIAALRLSPAAVGLTVERRHAKTGLVALLLFIVWGSCLGMLFKPGVPDLETLLFQATMPSLSEELVYRGIAPAILLGLFRRQRFDDAMPWGITLSTAVVFGAWHGLKSSNGAFGFDVMSALFPFIGSIPGGWLRYKTGSLLFPILAHSLANVAFHVAGGFAA
jgi:membrane protease YdiL (CAAX protease family)